MTSSHLKPQQISAELKHISLKKHQLLEKKKMHGLVEELRSRCVFGQTGNIVKLHENPYQCLDKYLTRTVHFSKYWCSYRLLCERDFFFQPKAAASNEAYSIDEEVKQLTERELELQKRLDEIVSAGDGENDKKGESMFTAASYSTLELSFSKNRFTLLWQRLVNYPVQNLTLSDLL